jgi:hypothetical protein
MTVEDRVSKLTRELGTAARGKPNGELRDVDSRIHAFETRFGVDSATLRSEVASGKRPETWDVCQWLMLLQERDRLVARTG